MARSHVKTVKVSTTAISGMFGPGSELSRDNAQDRKRIIVVARRLAPKRSRELANSHVDGGALKEGRYRLVGRVHNTAPHAMAVAGGTSRIAAHGPKGMFLPASRAHLPIRLGGKMLIRKYTVRGQRANHWLDEALGTVMSGSKSF